MLEINKIYNEDCLEGMKRIDDKSIDMILCDLPYGTTACKWDTIIPFEPLWEQYKRIIKDKGAIVLCGSEPFSSYLRLNNIRWFRYDIIWEKERPTNIFFIKKQIGKVHEIISIFYKHQPTYNPCMENRKSNTIACFGKIKTSQTHKNQDYHYSKEYDKSKIYPRSVLKINRDTLKGSLHPTQKPVALFEYLIKTYTNENELVLDNCMGSGTTAIACINTKRNYIGFELDENYYNIANERIEKRKEEMNNKFVNYKKEYEVNIK